MSDREKPLPKPHTSRFGRKKRLEEEEEDVPLMADRIAMAQAEGKLDEFLEGELPDSEHARKLVSMMMGMTGMSQAETVKSPPAENPSSNEKRDTPSAEPPEDILSAARAGDVQGLVGLLDRERRRRFPNETATQETPGSPERPAAEVPSVEKETIDLLLGIARDNDLSLDWIIMRALRLYIGEYKKTGRL